jgi:hypothetical protein
MPSRTTDAAASAMRQRLTRRRFGGVVRAGNEVVCTGAGGAV